MTKAQRTAAGKKAARTRKRNAKKAGPAVVNVQALDKKTRKAVKKGVKRAKKVAKRAAKTKARGIPRKLPVIRGPLLDVGRTKVGDKAEKTLKRLRNELQKSLKIRPGHPVFMTSLKRVEKALKGPRKPVVVVPSHFRTLGSKKRKEGRVTAKREAKVETKVQQAEERAYNQAMAGLGYSVKGDTRSFEERMADLTKK